MRRRLLPLLIAVLAVAVAVWQRSRRRAAALPAAPEPSDRTADGAPALVLASPRLLEAGPTTADGDHDEIAGQEGDPEPLHNHQVEPESSEESPGYGARFLSIAWKPVGDPPPSDATSLTIRFALLERHMTLDRIDVRETGSHVFVTVIARFEPPAGGWFAHERAQEEAVALRAPLGERTLVHAPTDDPPGPAA